MIKTDKEEFGIDEIAKGVGSTWRTTKGVLETLLDLGLVEMTKVGKRSKWKPSSRSTAEVER